MSGIKFKRTDYLKVSAIDSSGGNIITQSVEALLMLEILEKLEEIRCGVIDVENEIHNPT